MLEIQTKTLLAVCGHGSFSKAAEALSLTQPAVSHQIASLENEYGVKIFVRGRGELRLTPEGAEIVRTGRVASPHTCRHEKQTDSSARRHDRNSRIRSDRRSGRRTRL